MLTCADMVNGFITALHANSLPLIGAVQIMSGNERKSHIDHVLLSTSTGLANKATHEVSTDGLLDCLTDLLTWRDKRGMQMGNVGTSCPLCNTVNTRV